ncbi:serine hydrolase [Fontimonas sp. SYSU GA230001]|uniref:serine hydrolase n=1 Tax=Fontimonas sp. SYSU GA230001 TaxID=3142450 RepID=UPI0032B3649B
MNAALRVAALTLLSTSAAVGIGYPLDGYDYTGIRRLEHTRTLQAQRAVLPPGATLPMDAVVPSGIDATTLPAPDPDWSAELTRMLGDDADRYGVAVLDLSDPAHLRYAAHQPDYRANVGSVGKVLVLLAWMHKLADWYPQDIAARERVLRDTRVVADGYIDYDVHKVPIHTVGAGPARWRTLHHGDEGSLWEYMDWMISASSNAAGSMVMQQLAAAERFGPGFASGAEPAAARLATLSAAARGRAMLDAMLRPLAAVGLDPQRIRQTSLFTHRGKRLMPGQSSYATPRDLLQLLALIEAKRFVDPWSSREAKRLLYTTQKRIRYASHPVLNPAAVYFKSGSLYICEPEPGYVCGKYRGNKINQLASLALVEYPAQAPKLRYAVAVMSNVLRKNSAVAHQTLALRIHRMVEARHAAALRDVPAADLPPATQADAEGRGADED